MSSLSYDLERAYISLDGKGGVVTHPVGPDFWSTIDTNPSIQPTLITVSGSDSSWSSWEMHPRGDEILVLLQGEAIMVFERADGDEHIPMRAGSSLVVPTGVWHRAIIAAPMRMLFITYGEGTTHRPV